MSHDSGFKTGLPHGEQDMSSVVAQLEKFYNDAQDMIGSRITQLCSFQSGVETWLVLVEDWFE